MEKNEQHQQEKAILVAVQIPECSDADMDYSLEELGELAKTAGIEVVGTIVQKRNRMDRNNFLGKGKMEEVSALAEETGANLIITDDEMTALQGRRMEEGIGFPVLDRTKLILDIFAAHASSREGKLQVELAQLQYRLLRLAGGYAGLSRQRGGIGTKGPGETKLETDRRVLRYRIQQLGEELEKVVQDRDNQRRKRTERYAPLFALVGYTNAGKSTLLNALSGSHTQVCDGLFTTLDPTARRIGLANGRSAILSDTVGFIKKLPHSLIQAFRATLEDVVSSEVVVIVSDVSNPQIKDHIRAVREVLEELKVLDHDTLMVFNKCDRPPAFSQESLGHEYPNAIFISAKTGEGLDSLKQKMDQIMSSQYETVELFLPSKSAILKEIFQFGRVVSQEWNEEGVHMKAEVPKKLISIIEPYRKEAVL